MSEDIKLPNFTGKFEQIRELLSEIKEELDGFGKNYTVKEENIIGNFDNLNYSLAALQCFYNAKKILSESEK